MDTVALFSEAMLHFSKFGELTKELQTRSNSAISINNVLEAQKNQIGELLLRVGAQSKTMDAQSKTIADQARIIDANKVDYDFKAKECSELKSQLAHEECAVETLEGIVSRLDDKIVDLNGEVTDLKDQVVFYKSVASKASDEIAAIELRYNLQKEISTKQKDVLEGLHTAKRKRDGVIDVLPTLQDVTYDHVQILDSGRLIFKHSSANVQKTRFSLRVVEKSRSLNKGNFKVYYLIDGDKPPVYCRSQKIVINMMNASVSAVADADADEYVEMDNEPVARAFPDPIAA